MHVSRMLCVVALGISAGIAGCEQVSFPVAKPEEFTATLSGDNEVPPVATVASGTAVVGVVDDTVLIWRVDVVNMDSITASHIHAGGASVPGGVIVNLFAAPTPQPFLDPPGTSSCRQNADTALAIASSSVGNPTTITTTAAHKLTVGSKPLVRIVGHTGSVPSLNNEYTATVTGASTFTLPVDVTTGGTGGKAWRFVFINGTSPRCRVGFTNVLAQAQQRPGNLTVSAFQSYGTTPRERFDSLIALMRTGDVYVNVHTAKNGGGEIRGQLRPR